MKGKKLFVLGLGALLTLTGCGGRGNTEDGTKAYTLRSYVSGAPTNWNPHTWEDSSYDEIVTYTEIGFVDFTYDPEVPGGYKVVYEMADDIKDVTKDASIVNDTFKTKWGIEESDEGRVWEIDLNQNAKFASGLEIDANTYIESMKRLLDPTMKNYRANSYYSGNTAIVHAYNYYNAGKKALTNILSIPNWGVSTESDVYLDFANSPLFEETLGMAYKDVIGSEDEVYFKNSQGESLLTKYAEPVLMTDAIFSELKEMAIISACQMTDEDITDYFGSKNCTFDNISFDDVGLIAKDDHTLLYVTEQPIDVFNFNVSVTSLWLVNPSLYDSLKKTGEGLTTTSYGTNAATYDAFGPYKLVSFEADKQFKFERNENWYGWTDGKHEGQYQTTSIVVDVMKEHSTALLAFQKGELDSIALEQADLAKYGYSDYLRHTPETYTTRLVFDSNVEDLKKLEEQAGNGKNKQILSQYDFRKALSLCIDRTRFNAEGTAGNENAYALLNSLYYYDVANDPSSIYRNTDEAKKAITDLYEMEYGEGKTYKTLDEAYKAVTGLDVEKAKSLFTSAYNAAIKDGTYTAGQEIEFEIGYYDATTTSNTSQTNLIQEFVNVATKNTPLEGKITFKGKSYNGDTTRYDAIGTGAVEMANCAWGGAAFYPFSLPQVYCNPDYTTVNEIRSFDPTTKTLTIDYDWEGKGQVTSKTMTYQGWSTAIGDSSGEYFLADNALKLHILARLENGLLNLYNFAVLGSIATVSLNSKKIAYPTDEYNIMYGYGGIRYMTYKYDDAAWANYVSSVGGTINYE